MTDMVTIYQGSNWLEFVLDGKRFKFFAKDMPTRGWRIPIEPFYFPGIDFECFAYSSAYPDMDISIPEAEGHDLQADEVRILVAKLLL